MTLPDPTIDGNDSSPPHLASQQVVVIGLARDCERALPRALVFCSDIAKIFNRTRFVFVENGSIDSTRRWLEDWAADRNDCVIIAPTGNVESWPRTQRIAACRNAALDFVREKYSSYQLLVMLDMDLDLTGSNARQLLGVVDYLLSSPGVAGVFPNSSPVYYDLYALRHPFWCPDDVILELGSDESAEAYSKYIYSKQMYISHKTPPIKVDSAFGGMGVYLLRQAVKSTYDGIYDDGREKCEHVAFNKSIAGDLYVLPFWCLNAPYEHISPHLRPEVKSPPRRGALKVFISFVTDQISLWSKRR